MRQILRTLTVAVACGSVAVLGACSSFDEDSATSTVSVSDAASPDVVGDAVFNPALSGEDRVALVSAWARERNLLTAEEVVAALGESTAKVVDAESPEVSMDDWWSFSNPIPEGAVVMDTGVSYVLQREGDSRDVITFVSEWVGQGPAVAKVFEKMMEAEGLRNTPQERYDPTAVGIDAFAYETDGGSGALDRLVVVNTGDALVLIVASPASPDSPDPDLTADENLSRDQVDNLVKAAVEKMG